VPAEPRAGRRVARFLRRVAGLARKGLRGGAVAHDVGVRIVDLAVATQAAARGSRGTTGSTRARVTSAARDVVPPPLATP
jgi:hypothetical protein